jgi:predicted HTH domain antitoxin
MVKYKYDIKDKMNVKTLRLKDSLSTVVYTIAKEKSLTESEYIRSLIEKDISEYRLSKAIESYKNKEVNLSGASEIAGMPYREFMEKLDIKNVPLNMDTMPIEYGLSSIKKSLKKKK